MVYDERAEKRDGLKVPVYGVVYVRVNPNGLPFITSYDPKKGGRNLIRKHRWYESRGTVLTPYRSTREHVERWVVRKRLQFPGLRVVVEEE